MPPTREHLLQILMDNPSIILAFYDDPADPKKLTIIHSQLANNTPFSLPAQLAQLELNVETADELRPMIARADYLADPQSTYQACQNPPLKLGCQIQPANANWVGTAGSPAKWKEDDRYCWGLLTNWHVIADGDETVGRRIHQPTSARPPIGFLTRWLDVDPDGDNLVDCALADCEVSGNHSISGAILDIGYPASPPMNAKPGDPAAKIGRTTGLTMGKCRAVGAAAQVNYGDFTANFIDQDVYACNGCNFSAPGDSGSLIVHATTVQPMSLLFAGGGGITIGNPMRHVAAALELLFPFP